MTSETKEDSPDLPLKNFVLIMLAGLLPWLYVHVQLSLNGNIVWLLTAAERMLDGLPMLQNYFEVNPPLSILYNAPPMALAKILPVPSYYLVVGYFLTLIGAGAALVYAVIRHWEFLGRSRQLIILAAFIIANTIIVTVSIGERDQIVILGLMPFLLAQLSMTWGYRLPRLLFWPVMLLGVIAVLIKPHFGLLPTLLLLHRMKVQKRFMSIMRAPDFYMLAIGTVGYIAIVWTFFPDFVHGILPDVVHLYLPNKSYEYAVPQLLWHLYLFLTFLGLEWKFSPLEGRNKKLLLLLYLGAIAALVPFAVQMKAYYYHLIPAIVLFFCAFGLSLYSYASVYLKKVPDIGGFVLIALLGIAYMNRPLMLEFPKHDDYKNFPLTQEIAKCAAPCEAFMFNDNIEVMHPTFYYMGKQNASRFPSFWFLPALVNNEGDPAYRDYHMKYADMVGEDLANYRPKMLLIGQYWVEDNVKLFDYGAFFSLSPLFSAEWGNYAYDRTITVNRKPYFAGTELGQNYPLTYKIYLRKEGF